MIIHIPVLFYSDEKQASIKATLPIYEHTIQGKLVLKLLPCKHNKLHADPQSSHSTMNC